MNDAFRDTGVFIAHWALVPVATLCFYEGVRRLGAGRGAKRVAALALVSAVWLVGWAGLSVWGANTFASSVNGMFGSAPLTEVSDMTFAGLSDEDRARKSRLVARLDFENTGLFTEHYAPDGTRVRFSPTQEEVQTRETLLAGLSVAQRRADEVRTRAAVMLLCFGVALLGGALVGRIQRIGASL